jgi:hypothetical protein
MTVTTVHTTVVDLADHRRQRTFGTATQLIESLEQLGELPPIQTLQRLDIKAPRTEQLLDPEHRHTHLNPPITLTIDRGKSVAASLRKGV